jgi:hypothetical protein
MKLYIHEFGLRRVEVVREAGRHFCPCWLGSGGEGWGGGYSVSHMVRVNTSTSKGGVSTVNFLLSTVQAKVTLTAEKNVTCRGSRTI